MRLRIRGKYDARWLHLDHSPANNIYVSPECLISGVLIRDSLDSPRPWKLKTEVLIRARLNISFIEHQETTIQSLIRSVDAHTAQDRISDGPENRTAVATRMGSMHHIVPQGCIVFLVYSASQYPVCNSKAISHAPAGEHER